MKMECLKSLAVLAAENKYSRARVCRSLGNSVANAFNNAAELRHYI